MKEVSFFTYNIIILYIKDNQVEELGFKNVCLAYNMERIKFVSHL